MKQEIEIAEQAFETYRQENSLMVYLQQVQQHLGYISQSSIRYISQRTLFSESHIYGIITFYSQFRTHPVGKHIVKICNGTACHVGGSKNLARKLQEHLDVTVAEPTTADGLFTLQSVACLGCCALAPAMMIGDTVYGKLDENSIKKIIKEYRNKENIKPE